MDVRLATFNVENLFRRSRILNLRDEDRSSELLAKVRALQTLIDKASYTPSVRDDVFGLSAELLQYVDFRVDLGSFGAWKKKTVSGSQVTGWRIHNSCKGRGDWIGQITFREADFSDVQRKNTARVVKDVDADVLCVVETEGMDALALFNRSALSKRYSQFISIDSPNDPRHIDVGCLSKKPILSLRTHVFDPGPAGTPVFSRDCLEVAIGFSSTKVVHLLCNHFKSQRGFSQAERDKAAERRKNQAKRVSKILTENYNLAKDLVAVVGDLNEDTTNAYKSLEPLLDTPKLEPVVDPALPRNDRWTHYYEGNKKGEKLSQLDYLLASKALAERLDAVGFARRGIFEIDKITASEGAAKVTPYPSVTAWNEAASDHAALWADFSV